MSEIKMNTVENLPILEEVPENATLLAEIDGEFYRVKNKKKLDVVITAVFSEGGPPTFTSNVTYDELLTALKSDTVGRVVMNGEIGDGDVVRENLTGLNTGHYDEEDGSQTNVVFVYGLNIGMIFFEDGRIIFD